MVSFPTNSQFCREAEASDEAVRLDAILPDVLRRYGLSLGPNADRPAAREFPHDRRREIAEFRREPSPCSE